MNLLDDLVQDARNFVYYLDESFSTGGNTVRHVKRVDASNTKQADNRRNYLTKSLKELSKSLALLQRLIKSNEEVAKICGHRKKVFRTMTNSSEKFFKEMRRSRNSLPANIENCEQTSE